MGAVLEQHRRVRGAGRDGGGGAGGQCLQQCVHGLGWHWDHPAHPRGPSQGLDQHQDHTQSPLFMHWDPPVMGRDCHQDPLQPLLMHWEPSGHYCRVWRDTGIPLHTHRDPQPCAHHTEGHQEPPSHTCTEPTSSWDLPFRLQTHREPPAVCPVTSTGTPRSKSGPETPLHPPTHPSGPPAVHSQPRRLQRPARGPGTGPGPGTGGAAGRCLQVAAEPRSAPRAPGLRRAAGPGHGERHRERDGNGNGPRGTGGAARQQAGPCAPGHGGVSGPGRAVDGGIPVPVCV